MRNRYCLQTDQSNAMSIQVAICDTINSFPPAGFSVWQSDGENGDNVVAGQMSGYDWMTGHLAPIKQLLLLLHTQSVGEHLAPRQQPSCTLNWSVDARDVNKILRNTILLEAT